MGNQAPGPRSREVGKQGRGHFTQEGAERYQTFPRRVCKGLILRFSGLSDQQAWERFQYQCQVGGSSHAHTLNSSKELCLLVLPRGRGYLSLYQPLLFQLLSVSESGTLNYLEIPEGKTHLCLPFLLPPVGLGQQSEKTTDNGCGAMTEYDSRRPCSLGGWGGFWENGQCLEMLEPKS